MTLTLRIGIVPFLNPDIHIPIYIQRDTLNMKCFFLEILARFPLGIK